MDSPVSRIDDSQLNPTAAEVADMQQRRRAAAKRPRERG